MYAARFENNLGLEPYQYEPRRAVPSVDSDSDSHISSESEEEVDFGDWRVDTDEWCTCGQCTVMATAQECICCQELENAKVYIDELPREATCISENADFTNVVTRRSVLRAALIARADIRADDLKEPLTNR